MRITEIYQSIQGESSYAGLPCVFVRTTGCDLRCSWCDSEFTFTGGTQITLDQIMNEVEKYDCELVELTGGEPLLQPDIYELATRLADSGHTVLIETGGHRDISKLDPRVIRIMDLKCPASRECEKNLWANLKQTQMADQVTSGLAIRLYDGYTLYEQATDDIEPASLLKLAQDFHTAAAQGNSMLGAFVPLPFHSRWRACPDARLPIDLAPLR